MTETQKNTKKYTQRYTDEEEKSFITEWREVENDFTVNRSISKSDTKISRLKIKLNQKNIFRSIDQIANKVKQFKLLWERINHTIQY